MKREHHQPRTCSPAHRMLPASLRCALIGALLLLFIFAAGGCSGRRSGTTAGHGTDSTATQQTAVDSLAGMRLRLPDVPATLTDPAQRAEYLLTHYWDNYDFADTTLIRNADYTEQAFVDFIYLLPNVPQTTTRKAISTLIGKAAADPAMFEHFTELAESYLYDPNSPMRSEELYIPVLEAVIALPGLDDVHKIRPRHQLTMALKNRPGMRAADFAYTTATGKTARLSALKGDYTLLFFYDPDCPDCKRVKQYIAASEVFGELIGGSNATRLTVLALYTDNELDAWRSHLSEMPQGWTVGYDKGTVLRNKEVYDLRAIPTLYLLDKDKRVILKDATVEQLEAWLAGHEQTIITR